MSLNKVMLIGNVGRDPEVRYLDGQAGSAKVAQFTLATTERYRDRNNELRENTEWHNIVAWRGNADVCEKYVKKGTQLYVEGRIRTRSWDDQTGNKRYTTEIVADTIQLLGKKSDNPGAAQGGYQASGAQQGGYQQGYAAPAQQAPQAPAAPTQQAPAAPAQQTGYQPQQAAPAQQPYQAPAQAPTYQAPTAPQNGAADIPDDDLPF